MPNLALRPRREYGGPARDVSTAGAPSQFTGQTEAGLRPLEAAGGARQGLSLRFDAGSQRVLLLRADVTLRLQP